LNFIRAVRNFYDRGMAALSILGKPIEK